MSQQTQPLRRRKPRPSARTLLPFLRACVGSPVVVELTNDDVMRGMLESVDDGMNLILSGNGSDEGVRWTRRGTSEPRAVLGGGDGDGTLTSTPTPPPFFAPSLHVRGRRVRFVHLPPSIDPSTVVDAAREAAAAARAAYRREILTKAHGGAGVAGGVGVGGTGGGSRRKGCDAEEEGFDSGSSEGGGDGDDNNQYYYEDFDDDDDDEDDEEEEERV